MEKNKPRSHNHPMKTAPSTMPILTTTNVERWLNWLITSNASGSIVNTPKGVLIFALYAN